jgi:hypothetical protein
MTKDHLYQKYLDALNTQHFTHAKLLSLTSARGSKGEHRHIKFPQAVPFHTDKITFNSTHSKFSLNHFHLKSLNITYEQQSSMSKSHADSSIISLIMMVF